MKYTSTRDASVSCSFEEAICSGYAPGGGLYVPESLPKVTPEVLLFWSALSYPELAKEVLRLFISPQEIDDTALASICQSALQGFEDPNHAVPIASVGGIFVAELFHGPTFCFKDLGLRALVSLLSYFATRHNQPMSLLVATTGDTGPAAVKAVSDINNPLLTILVHYPEGQISSFQRKQLTTVRSPCVKVAAFQGGGDDMDRPIKSILSKTQAEGANSQRVTGVNSYNIGRPLMQMVHYIWAYLRAVETLKVQPGNPDVLVDVILPTGAMGNLVAGYMAKQMGVPLGKFCSGVNANDITARVMKTGQFHKSPIMHQTLSEAINIQLPYNFERVLYYLSKGNHAELKSWMEEVDSTSKNDLPPQWLTLLQQEFESDSISDEEMCGAIRQVLADFVYWADPHTAVAFAVAQKFGYYNHDSKDRPIILLSTASPCKFEEAVTVAVGSEGWKKYMDTEFPEAGKAILELEELDPVLYEAREGASLHETQDAWEAQAQRILEELARKDRWMK